MVVHGKWNFRCSCCLFLFVTVTQTVSLSVNLPSTRSPVATNSSEPRYDGIGVNNLSALCPKEIQNATNVTTSTDNNVVLCVEEKIYDDKNGSVSGNHQTTTRTVDGEFICENHGRPCIPLCCPKNFRITNKTCLEVDADDFPFPLIYHEENLTVSNVHVSDDNFHLFVRDPCNGGQRYKLDPDEYEEDAFKLLRNGYVHRGEYEAPLDYKRYCLGVVDKDKYDVVVCFEENDLSPVGETSAQDVVFPIGLIVSTPFLFATFLVYCIVPELRNMHGRTLRGYVGSLFVAYILLAALQINPQQTISNLVCVTMGTELFFFRQKL